MDSPHPFDWVEILTPDRDWCQLSYIYMFLSHLRNGEGGVGVGGGGAGVMLFSQLLHFHRFVLTVAAIMLLWAV